MLPAPAACAGPGLPRADAAKKTIRHLCVDKCEGTAPSTRQYALTPSPGNKCIDGGTRYRQQTSGAFRLPEAGGLPVGLSPQSSPGLTQGLAWRCVSGCQIPPQLFPPPPPPPQRRLIPLQGWRESLRLSLRAAELEKDKERIKKELAEARDRLSTHEEELRGVLKERWAGASRS